MPCFYNINLKFHINIDLIQTTVLNTLGLKALWYCVMKSRHTDIWLNWWDFKKNKLKCQYVNDCQKMTKKYKVFVLFQILSIYKNVQKNFYPKNQDFLVSINSE